jgi:hypothetical protein
MTNAVEQNIAMNKEVDAVRNVIKALLKGIKTMKMYPKNNPIYKKNMENICHVFKYFFKIKDKLTIRFSLHDLYYDSESVYNNPEKQDNLALLFFKDGVREITFCKDLTSDEIEDFLEISASDFDKDSTEDDLVTLLWQRDFQNIEYLAQDLVLTDDALNEETIVNELKQKSSGPVDLKRAYDDSFKEDEAAKSVPIIALTEDDYEQLAGVIERDGEGKLSTFFNMLFEMYYVVDRPEEYEYIVLFFMKSIEHAIKTCNFRLMTDVLIKLSKIVGDKNNTSEMRKSAIKIILFVSGKKMIALVGNILDSNDKIAKDDFREFICLFDASAITQLVNLLGDLQSMNARKILMDAMINLGPKDISILIKGLNHSKWYVVRNIIHILSQIGDTSVIKYMIKPAKHEDFRVRREALRALGGLGKDNVLPTIVEGLDDNNLKVRKTSLVVIGNIATNSAKKVIIERISDSSFIKKPLNEKKDYFEILARWKDKDVYDLCIKIIMSKSFWNKSKHYETKACSAYSLGLIGSKNALPILNKHKTSRNRLLNEFSNAAIKRIESER